MVFSDTFFKMQTKERRNTKRIKLVPEINLDIHQFNLFQDDNITHSSISPNVA